MLSRDRQMRMQVHQLVDACLFALSFWLAFRLREDVRVIYHLGLDPVGQNAGIALEKLVWLYPVLVFVSPLVLEAQGFYSQEFVSSRLAKYWKLLKGCGL